MPMEDEDAVLRQSDAAPPDAAPPDDEDGDAYDVPINADDERRVLNEATQQNHTEKHVGGIFAFIQSVFFVLKQLGSFIARLVSPNTTSTASTDEEDSFSPEKRASFSAVQSEKAHAVDSITRGLSSGSCHAVPSQENSPQPNHVDKKTH